MGQGWPGWYVPTADGAANYTVIPTKLDDADTAKNTSMYGVWTIGICNNSQNKELTLKLLEYLMDKDIQLASIDIGGVPCRYSCLTNADVLAKSDLNRLRGWRGVYRPVIEEWQNSPNILGTEMDAVIQAQGMMAALPMHKPLWKRYGLSLHPRLTTAPRRRADTRRREPQTTPFPAQNPSRIPLRMRGPLHDEA